MTLAEALAAARQQIDRLDARLLLEYATGYTHVDLLARPETEIIAPAQAQFDAWVTRRAAGEPLAYLIGEVEFRGRIYQVSPDVLIPRPETEHLVEATLARLPPQGRLWDLGTGSGAVAVTVALERPDAHVRASDISADALAVAARNAASLGAKLEFAQGSWFAVDRPSETQVYDVVVSNPPYIEAGDVHLQQGDLRFEPQQALTDFGDGLSCLRALAAGAPHVLKAGGWLLLEHGYNQGEAARALLVQHDFVEVATLPDLAGLDRITLGRKPA